MTERIELNRGWEFTEEFSDGFRTETAALTLRAEDIPPARIEFTIQAQEGNQDAG